jgi:hypothetical protein
MARHRRSHRQKSRKISGGSYSSAASYGTYVNGSAGDQYSRVFDQAGAYGQIPGNVIIGAQGQNVTSSSQLPTQNELSLIQKAGRRRHRSRSRRGGFLGQVINQAIVPFSILGMQQTYRRKRGGKRHTRKHRR